MRRFLSHLKLALALSKKDACFIVFRKYVDGFYEVHEQATLSIDRRIDKLHEKKETK